MPHRRMEEIQAGEERRTERQGGREKDGETKRDDREMEGMG